jgi:hypothetical protein
MSEISEYFQVPRIGNQLGDGVFNTYAGTEKGVVFKFFTQKILNQKLSEKAGKEVEENVDFVEYFNDIRTHYHARVDSHLFRDHPELYSHYQKWKEGKKADVSDVREWVAISHGEIVKCLQAGFFYIEQIHEATEDRLYSLGTEWRELKKKADLFIASKVAKREGGTTSEKFQKIEAENLSLKEALQEMQKQVAALAQSQARKPGRPRKEDTSLVIKDGASLTVEG